jgi:hypothetical protein
LHGKLLRIVGASNGAHIFGTLVPVEEPSTASLATFRTAEKQSRNDRLRSLLGLLGPSKGHEEQAATWS